MSEIIGTKVLITNEQSVWCGTIGEVTDIDDRGRDRRFVIIFPGGGGNHFLRSEFSVELVKQAAELAQLNRVKVALMTIASYSEDPQTWDEIVTGLEGEADRLQANALRSAGIDPKEVQS